MWGQVNGFERTTKPPTGVGTLRLRMRIPLGDHDWAMRVPNAYSATRVFVNGDEVAEIGRVDDRRDYYIPSNGIALPRFYATGGSLEIIMQVANFSTPEIGTWDSPIFGDATAILLKRQRDTTSTSFVAGALLIMGLYHLGLFLMRKKDQASLLFGIICLLMMVRTLMMGERLILDLFPPGEASWAWAFKIEHLSAHMTLPLFAFFFLQLFPRQVRRVPVAIIAAVGCLWAALIIATPPMVYQRFLHWYECFIIVAGLYLLTETVIAVVHRETGALIVVIGIVLLMGTAANDVLFSIGLIKESFYMASYGVFLYIFAQSLHLSVIFSKAFRKVEELSTTLLSKNNELESLHTVDLAIASSDDQQSVLDTILKQAVEHLGIDAADILLYDSEAAELSLGARIGFRTEALLHTRLHAGEGFAGRALESPEVIIFNGLDTHEESFNRSPTFSGEGFFFYAGKRLIVKSKIVGVLELFRRSPFRQYPSWELYFKALAGQAAVALNNSSLLSGLRNANEELLAANEATIEGWAEALELRDRETEGHSRRVMEMTLDMARRFGIAGDELECIRHGALLHDIGKMGIPDSILLKPGPLSAEEFEVMKRHPTIARNLLSRLRFLDKAMDIPYCHHEKWDGSGYPRGLAGEGIPLSARLFAVVDVWDALRSDRPYRSGWPEDKVLAHIASLSGSHFDPEAVDAFIQLSRDDRIRVE
jgi:HD-GYP domain-containing protein (c-di-GMP phosphodiesterase class II)